ncbi:MCE family protein [Amycolatopsis acidicola]|uniref:MCE family protein n=1 Tax=Amycolatopsis acidicola TaxID=2596893 RepID=A0A5N0UN47_9PSEU|nr:MlaD family protein [Amycolatopsis acidicola]KAA9151162.1 MCE family protein [Amycolatopsis acidicola]
MSGRGLTRSTLIQLALFLVVAVACTAYVTTRVLAANPLGGSYLVHVRMADTGGLTPTSAVTYRGVAVGTVEATRFEPGVAGVELDLRLHNGIPIPASSRAVVRMPNPIAIQSLDLQPEGDEPPYLADGSLIPSERTSRPVPLETLLVHFAQVADSVHTEDIAKLADELSTALSGSKSSLDTLLANAGPLLDLVRQNQPALLNLAGNAQKLAGEGSTLRQTAASMRQLTDQLRGVTPAAEHLLTDGPPLLEKIVPVLQQAQPSVSTLLSNLVTTSQILVSRDAALNELLVAMPDSLGSLASIEHDGVANFYLVISQGPACYYGTQRRPATDAGAREAQLSWTCDGHQPNLQQRGAANAPRPVAVTTYDTTTGESSAADGSPVQVGSTGGQAGVLGPRSWYSLFLQGAQGKGTP